MLTIDITQGTGLFIPMGKVEGWSDSSDCLSFPDAQEIASFKKGADGKMCASTNGERGGSLVIKVLANSPFVDKMAAYIALAKRGKVAAITFNWLNSISGDNISCRNGVLTEAPVGGPTYGKGEAGEVVYTFEFESIDHIPLMKR